MTNENSAVGKLKVQIIKIQESRSVTVWASGSVLLPLVGVLALACVLPITKFLQIITFSVVDFLH